MLRGDARLQPRQMGKPCYHKVTADATVTGEDKKVKGTKCSWCGGSMLCDDGDNVYKCILC